MVRGVTILLILTIFIQTNMGSIFNQFSTPEKRDKNKMLMFLRGLLKLDSPESSKGHINKRGTDDVPPVQKPAYQPVLDSHKLPHMKDKSKMLSYLRGLNTPNSAFSIYEEPKHHASLPINHNTRDTKINQMTQNANARMSQNPQYGPSFVINSQAADAQSVEQEANWDGATATQATLLNEAEDVRDSDTCFWRGQQSRPVQSQTGQKHVGRQGLEEGKAEAYVDFENVGEKIIGFWECIKKKFSISYNQLKMKICGILNKDTQASATTTTTTTTTTKKPAVKVKSKEKTS